MTKIKLGKEVTDIKLTATGDQSLQLSDFRGKKIVLYFYPKDSTPGCTLEGQDFRDNKRKFSARNTVILGVSRDSVKSHESFKDKQAFTFELLSDPDEKICTQFDVIKEKNMYGKKVIGIERSTFLIDEDGILIQEWRKVKVEGHVEEVLEEIKTKDKN
jgi:peroxiredoxin Q/BCP